jgi:hypothetical protein
MTNIERIDFLARMRLRGIWAFYHDRCYFFDGYEQDGKTPRLIVMSWKASLGKNNRIVNATMGNGDYVDFKVEFQEEKNSVAEAFDDFSKLPVFDGKTFPEVEGFLVFDDK